MERVTQQSVRLGGGHCCSCSVVCHHIGGPSICDRCAEYERKVRGIPVPQPPAPDLPHCPCEQRPQNWE